MNGVTVAVAILRIINDRLGSHKCPFRFLRRHNVHHARNKKIMGEYRSGWLSNTVVWITFMVMLASAIAMFYTLAMK